MTWFSKHHMTRTAGARPWRVTPSREEGKWDLRAAISGEIRATFFIKDTADHYARLMNLRDGYAFTEVDDRAQKETNE